MVLPSVVCWRGLDNNVQSAKCNAWFLGSTY